jgi:lipopolysaccharide transport system permease protein
MQKRVSKNGSHLLGLADMLIRYRALIWHLTRREFNERYAGQIIGLAWVIAHPLFLMLVYIVAFAYVIRVRLGVEGTPMDYTVYLLSGMVAWLASIECMNRAAQTITANPGFVRQMTFPAEVLPVRTVTVILPALLVSTAVLVIYSLFQSGGVLWTYALWPLVLILHLTLLLGVSYAIAAIGVYLRDVKELIALYAAAGFFLSPILYTEAMLPGPLGYLFYLNPASYLIWVYQDIFYYGAFTHGLAWLILVVAAPGSLYLGYRLFASLRPWFGEAV